MQWIFVNIFHVYGGIYGNFAQMTGSLKKITKQLNLQGQRTERSVPVSALAAMRRQDPINFETLFRKPVRVYRLPHMALIVLESRLRIRFSIVWNKVVLLQDNTAYCEHKPYSSHLLKVKMWPS
jgi:hypothetical protein